MTAQQGKTIESSNLSLSRCRSVRVSLHPSRGIFMNTVYQIRQAMHAAHARHAGRVGRMLSVAACALALVASGAGAQSSAMSSAAPSPDPRVGLRAGKWDAAEAVWNLRVLSKTRPPEK